MTAQSPAPNGPSAAMRHGRQADSTRRRHRVIAALDRALAHGAEISVSGIARAALLTELLRGFRQVIG
ncbi:MAG: hypothetical protein ACRDQH_08590 [Pseudonocardiaceae bacterium]